MPSEELLSAMAKFNEEMVKAGVMLDGNGLQASSKGARVRFSGDQAHRRSTAPSPRPRSWSPATGSCRCKSLAEAIEWIKRCPNPHDEDSEIEIRQLFELEDFGESPAVEHHRRLGERDRQEVERDRRRRADRISPRPLSILQPPRSTSSTEPARPGEPTTTQEIDHAHPGTCSEPTPAPRPAPRRARS